MSEIITVETSAITAVESARLHYRQMTQFVREMMVKDVDYGVIPGTSKPTLLKPGAEKLCKLFSLRPTYELVKSVEDFETPLFYFHYRCSLYHNGELMGQGEGNCNTRERRYERQQNRVFDLVNTVCKIAQKRSLIAAVLNVCGASEFFTQDLEDEEQKPAKGASEQIAQEKANKVKEARQKYGLSSEEVRDLFVSNFGQSVDRLTVEAIGKLSSEQTMQLIALIEKTASFKQQGVK